MEQDFGTAVGKETLAMATGTATIDLLSTLIAAFRKVQEKPEAQAQAARMEPLAGQETEPAGLVRYGALAQRETELEPMGLYMSRKELQQFARLAEEENIGFSAMGDSRISDPEQRQYYELLCQKADVEPITRMVDRLNDENRLASIDQAIETFEAQGENRLDSQEKKTLAELRDRREQMQRAYCYQVNDEQARGVTEQAMMGRSRQGISFDAALNRATGSWLDKGAGTILADGKEPGNYIRCRGEANRETGRLQTAYTVYRAGEKVLETQASPFGETQAQQWQEQKEAMKAAGGIGDTVFQFHSQEEFRSWADRVTARNEQELSPLKYEGNSGRAYGEMISTLEEKLVQNGHVYKEGAVLDRHQGNKLVPHREMRVEETVRISESAVIGKQIENYRDLHQLETAFATSKTALLVQDPGTREHALAQAQHEAVSEAYQRALNTEEALKEDRMNLHAVQAEREGRAQERGLLRDPDRTSQEDRMTLAEVKDEIASARNEQKSAGTDRRYEQTRPLERKTPKERE